jgi:hypothetical protein
MTTTGALDPLATKAELDAFKAQMNAATWNTAWGAVVISILPSSTSGYDVQADVGWSVTWTPVIGRNYVHRIKAECSATIAGAGVSLGIFLTNNTRLDQFSRKFTVAGTETFAWSTCHETFVATTPVTRKIRIAKVVGSGTCGIQGSSGNDISRWIVEDDGPVTRL